MSHRRAFTLIELLAVIAILGLLAALVFPNFGAARRAAERARTKARFGQWGAAIEAFKRDYGYYPIFDASNLINGGATSAEAGDHLFHDILAGRKRDGTAVSGASARQNTRRMAFVVFGESDFTPSSATSPNLLCNASGNPSIAVLVDRNLDGRINSADYADFPLVALSDGSFARPSTNGSMADFPAGGLRASVVFYCADSEATASAPRFILSWK